MPLLSPAEVALRLNDLPAWRLDGLGLVREFQFRDFRAAMDFVNQVAELAEGAQHHPDIDIRYNRVRLALTSHDAGGLTEKDFEAAVEIDRIA